MDETGDKNWGLIALILILIIGVLTMAFFTFRWTRPGGMYSEEGQTSSAPSAAVSTPGFTMTPPPVIQPPVSAPR